MRIINIPTITDLRGSLTFFEKNKLCEFDIRRIFFLHEIPLNSKRGGHAHYKCKQIIIPISGSFIVNVITKQKTEKFELNTPNEVLYVDEMSWVELENFSKNSICLVLADQFYEESDYIRDYNHFISIISN